MDGSWGAMQGACVCVCVCFVLLHPIGFMHGIIYTFYTYMNG